MHTDFGEWYRSAGIEPNGELLPNRWAAIDEYAPDRNDVISLARLFYRLGKPTHEFLSTFVSAFQKTDPAFKTRDNDHELRVLAGAELVDVIERSNTHLADMAALSLVCAAAGNLRPCPCVREIPEIAARYLIKRSKDRISDTESEADTGSRKVMLDTLTKLGSPYAELAKEFRQFQRQLSVVNEESNMLWWLFSEHSRDEGERWSKFSVPRVALMAGKELADLTRVIPGPLAATAFLDRAIRYVKSKPPASIAIKDAINDVPLEWRRIYVGNNCPTELEDLLPIGYGIKLSLTSPENDAWLPAFKQGTGISSDTNISPHILAYQIFLEAPLSRSWKELV